MADLVVDIGLTRREPHLEARFTVPPGITVLFGPSGAGKSTCLSVIAGLRRPDRGRVAIGDEILDEGRLHVPPHQRRVALVFQSLALFPHLDGLGNVGYGCRDQAQAQAWLERMRVPHLARRRPATYSGGEAQRVALARALASAPRVLLLDEPFSALDDELRAELGAEVAALARELAIPTVLVTHDRRDAAALGTAMVMMRAGRVEPGPGAPR